MYYYKIARLILQSDRRVNYFGAFVRSYAKKEYRVPFEPMLFLFFLSVLFHPFLLISWHLLIYFLAVHISLDCLKFLYKQNQKVCDFFDLAFSTRHNYFEIHSHSVATNSSRLFIAG